MSLKDKRKSLKITPNQIAKVQNEEVGFSFKYLTTNSNYNFEFFEKSKHDCIKSKAVLLDKIEEITQQPWIHWHNQSKYCGGIERIPAKELKFKPNDYEFSEGDKVIVFRFNGDKYRIIGIKFELDPFYYVVGFDFDHSAYNHGS